MLWIFIFAATLMTAVLSLIYLASRFAKFKWILKLAKEKKFIRYVMGLIPAFLILIITSVAMGIINAIVILIHLMIFWLICDGINFIINKKRKKEFVRYYAGMAAIGITVVYLACGWYLAHHVWRTEYVLKTDKELGNLRIVQFADSHVGTTFHGEEFAEYVEAMQAENPDIVVITGDFVDDDSTREDMIASCKALGTLKATFGVYFSFGNHDKSYYGAAHRGYSGDDLIAELEKNHVTVLQDEKVLLDNRFYLIGRQDLSEEERGGGRASMEELVSGLDADKYSIVLDHQPHEYDAQADAGVDLVLSGHTHGGQLIPINRAGEWIQVNDRTYGMEKRNSTNFIVTSGISDWAIKFKTGCKSEYVVIDVQGN